MTPLDALAQRLSSLQCGCCPECEHPLCEHLLPVLAREALRWVEEQAPTPAALGLILENAYGDSFSPESRAEHERVADALHALLRERLGLGKGTEEIERPKLTVSASWRP